MSTQTITRAESPSNALCPTPDEPVVLATSGAPGCRTEGELEALAAAEQAELMERVWWRQDLGMATAEYAIATLAACGFAGLLLLILRSDEVRSALTGIITRALSMA